MKDQAYKTIFKRLADMREYVGKEIGLSDWIVIDQDTINAFAKLTQDEQWIHVDEEKSAKYSPYKKTVAHGFLVLSFGSKFAYECYEIQDAAMGLNYGFEKIRFPNATPVGSKVRGRFTLLDYELIPGGAKYKMNILFELEGQEKPACAAEWIAMAYTA